MSSSMLPCVAGCCSVLQCVATMCCSELQFAAVCLQWHHLSPTSIAVAPMTSSNVLTQRHYLCQARSETTKKFQMQPLGYILSPSVIVSTIIIILLYGNTPGNWVMKRNHAIRKITRYEKENRDKSLNGDHYWSFYWFSNKQHYLSLSLSLNVT